MCVWVGGGRATRLSASYRLRCLRSLLCFRLATRISLPKLLLLLCYHETITILTIIFSLKSNKSMPDTTCQIVILFFIQLCTLVEVFLLLFFVQTRIPSSEGISVSTFPTYQVHVIIVFDTRHSTNAVIWDVIPGMGERRKRRKATEKKEGKSKEWEWQEILGWRSREEEEGSDKGVGEGFWRVTELDQHFTDKILWTALHRQNIMNSGKTRRPLPVTYVRTVASFCFQTRWGGVRTISNILSCEHHMGNPFGEAPPHPGRCRVRTWSTVRSCPNRCKHLFLLIIKLTFYS